MVGYLNTEREVEVLPEAKKEAKSYQLSGQLDKLEKQLKSREPVKGFKKIEPKSANTYEARLNIHIRAYMIFDEDKAIIIKVGKHL